MRIGASKSYAKLWTRSPKRFFSGCDVRLRISSRPISRWLIAPPINPDAPVMRILRSTLKLYAAVTAYERALCAKALIFDAACGLQHVVGMNSEFDRLVERAADPNLIPGIYNYCDGRCPRCPFNERCLSFLENRDLDAQQGPATNDEALAEALERSIQRTIEFLKETAKREGFDLSAALAAGPKASEDASDDPARPRGGQLF